MTQTWASAAPQQTYLAPPRLPVVDPRTVRGAVPAPLDRRARVGKRCAVTAPGLLALTIPLWIAVVAVGYVGMIATMASESEDTAGRFLGAAGTCALVAALLWLASVVLSIAGVVLARNAPRVVAAVTLIVALLPVVFELFGALLSYTR